jgi:DNA-binding beta-propeller fold protein YncE
VVSDPARFGTIAVLALTVLVGVASSGPAPAVGGSPSAGGPPPSAHPRAPIVSAPSPPAPIGPIGGRLFTTRATPPDGVTNTVSGLAVDPAGGTVFAANRYAGTVTAFDEATGALRGVVAVAEYAAGTYPAGLALDPAHHRVLVSISTGTASPLGAGWLLVLNETTLAVMANVSFPAAPLGEFEPTFLAVDPPTDQAFVENATFGEIAAVNLSTYSVSGYLPCPVALCAMHGYGLLDVPEYHTLLLPTCQPELWLVDTRNDSTRAVVDGPPDTIMAWSVFDSTDQTLWVENYTYTGSTGSFLRYNLSTLSLLGNVVGAPPRGSAIGYDAAANLLIATDLNGSEQISTYAAANATLVASYSAGPGTLHPFTAVAVDPVTGRVVASGTGNGTTVAFSLPSLAVLETYPSFPLAQPFSAVDPGAGRAYVVGVDPTAVRALNESSGGRLWETPLPAGTDPGGLALDATDGALYVTDSAGGRLLAFNATTGAPTGTYALGPSSGPCGVAVDAPLSRVFVAEQFPPAVVAVDPTTGGVTVTAVLASPAPCRLVLDPASGDLLALATVASGGLTQLLLPSLQRGATWSVPSVPVDLAVGPNGTAYVLDGSGAQVTLLNTSTGAAVGSIDLMGRTGSGVAFDAVDDLVLVTDARSATIAIARPWTAGVLGTLPTGGATSAPAFDGVTGTLVAPLTSAGAVGFASTVPVPSAPLGLTATAANTSADLHWTAPAESGPYPVDGYQLDLTPATGPSVLATSGATSTVVTGLVDGRSYTVEVVAHSAAGNGTDPARTVVTPAGIPYPPTAVTARATGPSAVVVAWSPPRSDDGAPVADYVVTVRATGGGSARSVDAGTADTTTVDGLAAATGYSFTVVAVNAVGASHPSAPADASTTPAPPSLVEPVVLGAAAVVAAGGIAGILWRRRRRRPPAEVDPDPPRP